MLINLTVVSISQYIRVSNYHVHLKLTQFYMSIINKAKKNLKRREKENTKGNNGFENVTFLLLSIQSLPPPEYPDPSCPANATSTCDDFILN